MWSQSRKEPHNAGLRARYREVATQCRRAMREHYIKVEERVVSSDNVGRFYKYVNKKLACKSGVGTLVDTDGNMITDDAQKANLLNQFFTSVCTTDDGCLPPVECKSSPGGRLTTVKFTPSSVCKAI